MITAVDTSVLLDIFKPDPVFGPMSRQSLRIATKQGRLVACDIVWAEIAGSFSAPTAASETMHRLEIEFNSLTEESALAAGAAWRSYRKKGGRRERMVADFLVGAHALCQAQRLLTRDRGFYRGYFSKLIIMEPKETR